MLTQEQLDKANKYFQKSPSGIKTVGDYMMKNQEESAKTKTDSIFSRLKEDTLKRYGGLKETAGLYKSGKIGAFEAFGQGVGQAAGAVGDVVMEGATGAFRSLPDVVEQPIRDVASIALETKTGQKVVGKVQEKLQQYEELRKTNLPAAKDLEAALNILGLLPASKVLGSGLKVSKKVANKSLEGLEEVGKLSAKVKVGVSNLPANLKAKAIDIISLEPDEKVKTILREVKPDHLDEYVKIAEKAVIDPRAQTGFEKVGEKLSDAAEQLNKQRASIGKSKTSIINQAKIGLEDFTAPVRTAILEVNRLGDNISKTVLDKLKSVRTKLDADKAIDEVQDILYKGNRDLTIPTGSKTDLKLKSIIGKLNGELKNSLPKAYRDLNKQYSDYSRMLEALNKSLGEVVDGVPVRGASLVKQFFSPAGSKSKEIFEFVKKRTGIDLSHDATLAKFTMELFDDPRARALLEGIPTSVSGIAGKALNILGEKSGLFGGLREASKQGTLKKARGISEEANKIIR